MKALKLFLRKVKFPNFKLPEFEAVMGNVINFITWCIENPVPLKCARLTLHH